MANEQDRIFIEDVGAIILSIFIPIIGYIQFFRLKDTNTKEALAVGHLIAAIGGSIIGLICISMI